MTHKDNRLPTRDAPLRSTCPFHRAIFYIANVRRPRFQVRFNRPFRQLDSEIGRLHWLVTAISRKLAQESPAATEENLEILVVATAWLRLAMTYGQGLVALAEASVPDGGYPMERALFELYIDFQYLLRHGDPLINARRVRLAAAFELLDHFKRSGDQVPLDNHVRALVDRETLADPATTADLIECRQKRRFHWTGQSRRAVGEVVLGDSYSTLYRVMSWEAHAVLTAVRDYSASEQERRITFSPFETEAEIANGFGFRAGGFLWFMYHEYAAFFGLTPLPRSD